MTVILQHTFQNENEYCVVYGMVKKDGKNINKILNKL